MKGRWRHDRHTPGSITIRRTDEVSVCRFPKPQDADYRAALIYIPVGQLVSAAEHYRRLGQRLEIPEFNVIGRDPALAQMGLSLYEAMTHGADDLYAETAAAWIAVHLLSRYGTRINSQDRRSGGILTDARLARVIEYMSSHFAETLTLERLAAEACISKYHFVRLFRERVGQSPHRYLAELRLEAAQRMLISSELSIIEIALECGYSTPTHFSTAFARRFGMSPTSFRMRKTVL
jgi:AraC family transcriptional regulator